MVRAPARTSVIVRRALLVLALAPSALTGCGGGDGSASGDLVWEKPPSVSTPETLPDDRVATGRIRNDSLRQVDLKATDIRVVDASEDVLDLWVLLKADHESDGGPDPRLGIQPSEVAKDLTYFSE